MRSGDVDLDHDVPVDLHPDTVLLSCLLIRTHGTLAKIEVPPTAKDITQRCLGRILLWEAEQGARGGRSAADIDKLNDCTATFLGALFNVPRHAWFRTAVEARMFTGKLSKYSWRASTLFGMP